MIYCDKGGLWHDAVAGICVIRICMIFRDIERRLHTDSDNVNISAILLIIGRDMRGCICC